MTTTIDSELEKKAESLRLSDGDLQEEYKSDNIQASAVINDNKASNATSKTFHFIPLRMGGSGGTHKPSKGSLSLIENEVTLDDLKMMTSKFYELAFMDDTLDKFIRSRDDPHGDRFAKWIHQKLSGSNVWDRDREERSKEPVTVAGGRTTVVEDRTSAHVAAWHSPKRPSHEVGRRFKLEECRVWMRLHFWALRQSGLMTKSPSFANYYVRFIGHFIRVYESTAPLFTRDSFRWSSNPKNIKRYIESGRRMKDVIGLSFERALSQLPASEVDNDMDWPYNSEEVPEATEN